MPNSIEIASEIDLNHENVATDGSERSGGGSSNISKKYRHQNYSKNIYIGTKNAEKWELTRSKLSFKNDVEFVNYLLSLAETDFINNDGRIHNNSNGGSRNTTTFPSIHLETNLNEKLLNELSKITKVDEKSAIPKNVEKVKKVKFHDDVMVNGGQQSIKNSPRSNKKRQQFFALQKSERLGNLSILCQNSQDAQDNSITSTIESYGNTSNSAAVPTVHNIPEVLDCRIAEKIKNELEQKLVDDEKTFKNKFDHVEEALCLTAKSKDKHKLYGANNSTGGHINWNKKEQFTLSTSFKSNRKSKDKSAVGDFDDENSENFTKKIILKFKSTKKDIRKTPKIETNLNVDNADGAASTTRKDIYDYESDDYENKSNILDSDKDEDVEDEDDYDDGSGEDIASDAYDDDKDDDEDDDVDDDEVEEQFEATPEADIDDLSRINLCRCCYEDHTPEECPLKTSNKEIVDSIDLSKWNQKYGSQDGEKIKKEEEESEADDEENSNSKSQMFSKKLSYSECSIPAQLELKDISAQIHGVFAKTKIEKYTRLGPLVGTIIPEVDISDDCRMQFIHELYDGSKSTYISFENKNQSNWLRYMRPAANRDIRNIAVICVDQTKAYFVTCSDIEEGCELLYWSDDCNSAWGKKKIEKINCGGCNIKFEHPLYYRTHCSVFHDPSFSLTIRKYHCKICGSAVLGKDNIMKHAAQMHDGKGAYQCQFCKKFFLRLNYLEMHRTYGCSANPQRARPLCDFCGRKFCQPQKLKVHIKRMHSDMADVLRDFQCKICSKLLGSRAALQRHSKEVHSRNSAVVSCPRCQKLFQNRSNLKIHMLTHSGVRPFKCIEGECNAAFTTKQCLQFHYKKVHSYAQEQMPKIERSVAYTFDAYSGGMKVEYLEQAPRRRRKSLEEQNSLMSSSAAVIRDDNKSETDDLSDDNNMMENIKKSGKSISNLCKNETNLSLLSSRISSILEHGIKHRKRDRKSKLNKSLAAEINEQIVGFQRSRNNSTSLTATESMSVMNKSQEEYLQSLQHKRNKNNPVSLIETYLQNTATRQQVHQPINSQQEHQQHHEQHQNDDELDVNDNDQCINELDNNSFNQKLSQIEDEDKLKDFSIPSMGGGGGLASSVAPNNIIASKGSRKWIGSEIVSPNIRDDKLQDKLINQPNRDFLSRLMMNSSPQDDEDEENSSFLDVVDTNNHHGHAGSSLMSQYSNAIHHEHSTTATTNLPQLPHLSTLPHLHTQSFIGSFYNNNIVNGSAANRAGSSSASMLVEAALSSVGNMIADNNNISKNSINDNNVDNDNLQNTMEVDINSMHGNGDHNSDAHDARFTPNLNTLSSIENEIKLIKHLNSFPLQMPNLPHFDTSSSSLANNLSNQTLAAHKSPNDNNLPQDIEIDVDNASTPRTVEPTEKIYQDNDNFGNHNQHTPPTPQHHLSPGRDYNAYSQSNNIGVNSLSHNSRRNYSDHELISPATSPSLPRYGFRVNMCRKRELEEQIHNNLSSALDGRISQQQQNMSSDDENSIMAQNLSMGSNHNNNNSEEMQMKFNSTQMDLMYAKYENNGGGGGEFSDQRSKYMEQNLGDISSFRGVGGVGSGSNGGGGGGVGSNNDSMNNDMQGLDMSSRTNLSVGFHHNYQLPTTNPGLNIGRYHHHIYDILSEREQQQQQQQEHSQQLQHQHMHHLLQQQDQMSSTAEQEQDQTTSVDLSRSGNYNVPSPSPLPYSHSHSEMLRLSSLELPSNSSTSMAGLGSNRGFLSSQNQHNASRESLSVEHHRYLSNADQHRLLSANSGEQIGTNHRLLVDPATHLLMEQNSRLLSSDQPRHLADSTSNRHMVSPRGFGAYHQVTSGNYHHAVRPLASPTHHSVNPSTYHPFSSYY